MATQVYWIHPAKNTDSGGYISWLYHDDKHYVTTIANRNNAVGFRCVKQWEFPLDVISDHYESTNYHTFFRWDMLDYLPATFSGTLTDAKLHLMVGLAEANLEPDANYIDIDVYYPDEYKKQAFPFDTLDQNDYDKWAIWNNAGSISEDMQEIHDNFEASGYYWLPAFDITTGVQLALASGWQYFGVRLTPSYLAPSDYDWDDRPVDYNQECYAMIFSPAETWATDITPSGFPNQFIPAIPWLELTFTTDEDSQEEPGESGDPSAVLCVAADPKAQMAIAGTITGKLWYTWEAGSKWTKIIEPFSSITAVHVDFLRNFLDYPDNAITWHGTISGELWKSVDSLASFTRVDNDTFYPNVIVEVMSSDTDSNKVVVGCDDKVYTSINGGQTWRLAKTSSGGEFAGMFIRDVEIQAVFNGGEAYRSPDFGVNWYDMTGEPTAGVDIGFDILDETNSFIGSDGYLYTAESGVGGGLNYSQAAAINGLTTQIDVDWDSQLAIIGTDQALHKTTDFGATVKVILNQNITDCALGGEVLVEQVPSPYTGDELFWHFMTCHPNGELYICTRGSGVTSGHAYKSLDYGATWIEIINDENAFAVTPPPAAGNRYFKQITRTGAGYVLNTWWASGVTNGGTYFSPSGLPGTFSYVSPPSPYYHNDGQNCDLYCANGNSMYVYTTCGYENGIKVQVFRSLNGGATWELAREAHYLSPAAGKVRQFGKYVWACAGGPGGGGISPLSDDYGEETSWTNTGMVRGNSYGWNGGSKAWGALSAGTLFYYYTDYWSAYHALERPEGLKGKTVYGGGNLDSSTVNTSLIGLTHNFDGVVAVRKFWVSYNDGNHWDSYEIPDASNLIGLCFDRTKANIVYAIDRTKGIFKSVNGGITWMPSNNGITI